MLTNLIILKNPFNLNQKECKLIELKSETTLKKYLEINAPVAINYEYHASINGRIYKPEEIGIKLVKGGDFIVVCPVLKGGGGNGGSNPLAILAGIALAVFSFGVVSPFVGGLFGGGFAGQIAGTIAAGLTMMVGGQLISNAFAPSLRNDNAEINSEISHGWTALNNLSQQGSIIPITYGTVRTAGQILSQHVEVDENSDDEYLYLVLSGGEGPIVEFSDIRINDNPIANFGNDVTYETRHGYNTQDPCNNYAYASTAVNVNLNNGTKGGELDRETPGEWHTVDLSSNIADYIAIHVNFPKGLCFYSDDSPDPQDDWVVLQFQYRYKYGGGTWTQWFELTGETPQWATYERQIPAVIGDMVGRDFVPRTGYMPDGGWLIHSDTIGKKTSTFSRRLFKLLNPNPSSYYGSTEIQVRGRVFGKDKHDNKHSRCLDDVVWSAVSAVVATNFIHPNKALVILKIKATDNLNGGMPTITWKQKRNQVLVYDNGQWVSRDAQNPAWIIYDLCVHARMLDGVVHVMGEPPSRIDLPAFKAWAAWNDRTLNNRPAMRMNLLVDESKSLFEWCNDIAASARGAIVLKGTKISCIFDAPSEPVQLFSMGNILGGSFSGEFLPINDRANAVEIAFNNEANNFEREQITVYADGVDDSDTRQNPVSVQLTGITDFERAYREGIYRLNQNKYLLRTITFSAEIDAIACQVGDVILVQHDIPQWGQGGRIFDIDYKTLTLDREVVLNPANAYIIIIRKSDDTRVQYNIANALETTTTNKIILQTSADVSDLNKFDVFTIGQINKTAKPFRVQEITRTGDLQVTLTCLEYIAEIYTEATNIPVIDYTETTNNITGLQIVTSGYYTEAGQWVPEIVAFWSYIGERPASYEIQIKFDNETWQKSQFVNDTRVQIPVRNAGTVYHIRVRALYTASLPCEWAYAYNKSVIFKPSLTQNPPTGLLAKGWFGYASLTWNNPTNPDFNHIEVWEATEDDLAKATHIGNTYANSYTRLMPSGGALWYWVRAVNNTGTKSDFNSQAGTLCVINVTDHESYITNLLEQNPYLLDIIEELNERIDPIEADIDDIYINLDDINIDIRDIKDIQLPAINTDISNIKNVQIPEIETEIEEIKNTLLPTIDGRIKDNQDYIHQILMPAIDRIGEGILRLNHETVRTRNVFRWAGFEVNEDEGTVVIQALEDLKTETGYQFTNVIQRLDAQEAEINLKASRVYVDGLIDDVNLDLDNIKDDIDDLIENVGTLSIGLDSLVIRVNQAEIDINAAEAAIALKADSTTVSALGARLNTAEIDIDALESSIVLKAEKTELNATNQRVTTAEQKIDALDGTVSLTVSDYKLLQDQINKNADGITQNAINNANAQAERRLAIAEAKEEFHAEIADTNEAIAQHVTTLTALIDDNAAQILEEETARTSEDEALSQRITTLQTKVGENTSAIQTEATTRADADTALGTRITTLQTKVDGNTSAIQTEATTRADADTALGSRITTLQTKVDGNTSAIQTEATTRADADTASTYERNLLQAQINYLADAVTQNSINTNASIEERRIAIADTNKALAQYTQTLTTRLDDHTASLQTLNEVKNGVTGRHYVKIDSNGYVSGYELYNGGGGTSSFVLSADKFLISRPGVKAPKQMFAYDSASGKFIVPNILVDGAQIKDATIEKASIVHGEITTPYLTYSANGSEYVYSLSANTQWTPNGWKTLYVQGVANTPLHINFGSLIGTLPDPLNGTVTMRLFINGNNVVTSPITFMKSDIYPDFYYSRYYIYTPSADGTVSITASASYNKAITGSTPFVLGYPYIQVLALYR